jgi:uncharacterized membrane protein YccC
LSGRFGFGLPASGQTYAYAPPVPLLRRVPVHDPGRVNLRKATRVAIVMPILLAIGIEVLDNPAVGLFAAFGSFTCLVFSDFGGEPVVGRLRPYLVLGVVGAVLIAIGTVLSGDVVLGTLTMALVAFVVLLSGVVGGAFAAASSPAILAYVLAVTVPAPADQAVDRGLAWIAAAAVSGLAAMLLWPKHEHAAVREGAAVALRAVATAARAPDDAAAAATATAAIDAVRQRAAGVLFRSTSSVADTEATVAVVSGLVRARPFVGRLGPAAAEDNTELRALDAELRAQISTTLEAAAGVLEGHQDVTPDLRELEQARGAHRDALERWAAAELGSGSVPDDVLAALDRSFPIRVLSHVALTLAGYSWLVMGGPVAVPDAEETPVLADADPVGRRARSRLRALMHAHLTVESASCQSAVRGAVGLSIAIGIALSLDLEHAFWVVLGTLSVLRSSALGTGATALRALAGTLAGFFIAAGVVELTGDETTALWIILPVSVFLAAYTPGAVHFVVGQASFTVFVVVLFNLVQPSGVLTAVTRVENIAIGCAVSVAVGLLFWPRGARTAFCQSLATLYRVGADHLRTAFAFALAETDDGALPDEARDQAVSCRRQADDAFAQFANERTAQQLPVETWALVLTATTKVRLAADAVVFHAARDYHRRGCEEGGDAIHDYVAAIADGFDRLADRLGGAQTALLAVPEPPALRTGVLACMEEHAPEGTGGMEPAFAVVWMADWLRFVDHVLESLEAPTQAIEEIVDRPWWR